MLLAAATVAHAQTSVVTRTNPVNAVAMQRIQFWTPERFRAAKPLPLPLPQAHPGLAAQEAATVTVQRPEGADGHAPLMQQAAASKRLFTPAPQLASAVRNASPQPQAKGTVNAPYTSTRVFPMFDGANAQFSADRAYPYSTVGILFFTINGQPYLCSASVIQRRVISTAGHCVHSGETGGFYDNWIFVPAFRDGVAPLGVWQNWRRVSVTSTWASGGGVVPNAADYAMIVFDDQAMEPGGPAMKLGDVTGWLGWQTQSLAGNHTSKLGYPCNLDGCEKMQNVMSHALRRSAPNNVEYGSDAEGGSSGGPWVQNFETPADGGGTGANMGLNRIVGVTSYGYTDPNMKVQGAAILDQRWKELLKVSCGDAGNCE
jgi:V8-like Glu-specific endopeptidase